MKLHTEFVSGSVEDAVGYVNGMGLANHVIGIVGPVELRPPVVQSAVSGYHVVLRVTDLALRNLQRYEQQVRTEVQVPEFKK